MQGCDLLSSNATAKGSRGGADQAIEEGGYTGNR